MCPQIAAAGANSTLIEPAFFWETNHIESFSAVLRDELVNSEFFSSLKEA